MKQPMTTSRRRSRAGFFSLFFTVVLVVSLFSGAVSAGLISVDQPSGSLSPGVPVTLSVYLNGADDVDGLILYIREDSDATMYIKPGTSEVPEMKLNSAKGKAYLFPSGLSSDGDDPDNVETHDPLNGRVKLFDIEVTPATGQNVLLTYDVAEVLDSSRTDVTDDYDYSNPDGPHQELLVTNGKTVNTYAAKIASEKDENGIEWYDPSNVPISEDQGFYSSISGTSSPTISPTSSVQTDDLKTQVTKKPTTTKTKKSPGFLPITIGVALGLAGLLVARARKGGR